MLLLVVFSACAQPQPTGLAATVSDGDLEGRISVDHEKLQAGEPVHITFTLTNTGHSKSGEPQAIQSKSQPVMDIEVFQDGKDLQRWSTQQASDQISHRLELKPGESKTIELTWIPDQEAVLNGVSVIGSLTWIDDYGNDARIIIPGTLKD